MNQLKIQISKIAIKSSNKFEKIQKSNTRLFGNLINSLPVIGFLSID